MVTRPCKLQEKDYERLEKLIDEYFSEREEKQEVRELKNGDKRVCQPRSSGPSRQK